MKPASILFALSLSSLNPSFTMDCTDLDYSFGYVSDASDADLTAVGKVMGTNAETESSIDVTCTYVNYNGFQMYFQDDGLTEVTVYAYVGTPTDASSEQWSCAFDASNRKKLQQEYAYGEYYTYGDYVYGDYYSYG